MQDIGLLSKTSVAYKEGRAKIQDNICDRKIRKYSHSGLSVEIFNWVGLTETNSISRKIKSRIHFILMQSEN